MSEYAVTILTGSAIQANIAVPEQTTIQLAQPDVVQAVVSSPAIIQATISPPSSISSTLQVGQGPAGPAGPFEEYTMYSKRIDMVSESVIYKGEASVGSTESASVWRIRKLTVSVTGNLVDVTEEWANGTANFEHAWDQRTDLLYS